jgi:hypothetical protein
MSDGHVDITDDGELHMDFHFALRSTLKSVIYLGNYLHANRNIHTHDRVSVTCLESLLLSFYILVSVSLTTVEHS